MIRACKISSGRRCCEFDAQPSHCRIRSAATRVRSGLVLILSKILAYLKFSLVKENQTETFDLRLVESFRKILQLVTDLKRTVERLEHSHH